MTPSSPLLPASELGQAIEALERGFAVVDTENGPMVATAGTTQLGGTRPSLAAKALLAHVSALPPAELGNPSFRKDHGVKFAYVAGAMANGIASAELVIAMARHGMLGFFGAAGLPTERIEAAITQIKDAVPGLPWGVNLIHSPAEPWQEQETVELLLRHEVHTISASAYMALTPMLVQYRATGLSQRPDGTIEAKHKIFAKVSRPEVAERFLRPPPKKMLDALVAANKITAEQARLASMTRVADDLTAEADSGGHTDNRPLPVLLPLLQGLAAKVAAERDETPARIGAAGGIGDPVSAALAFQAGADFVLTGTINQACTEAGTSPMVRELLATAGMADVGMAPASDMFEGGVEVQVLKRGTLFAMRGHKLYELYRAYDSVESLPAATKADLEKKWFRASLEDIWQGCTEYFAAKDPKQLERAATDPKHKMALIFRWYLGMSSRWAIGGDTTRKMDAQIWCGPCIGSFNAWTAGTFLADPANRSAPVVAANLMAGAAAHIRAQSLRQQGIDPGSYRWVVRPLAPIGESHAA